MLPHYNYSITNYKCFQAYYAVTYKLIHNIIFVNNDDEHNLLKKLLIFEMRYRVKCTNELNFAK